VTRTREKINAFSILTGQFLGKQQAGLQKGCKKITLRCIMRFDGIAQGHVHWQCTLLPVLNIQILLPQSGLLEKPLIV
jgi:hypothetical protein